MRVKGEDHQIEYAVGDASHIHSLGVEWLIPSGIQPTHSGRKVRSTAVLGGNIPRVLGNTIIHPIDCFNKLLQFPWSADVLEPTGERRKPCRV